jgi:hypothetical protein
MNRVISKVWMTLDDDEVWADLIHENDRPFAVLEWGDSAGHQFAQVKVPLDETQLIPISPNPNGTFHYRYDLAVHDPRKLN